MFCSKSWLWARKRDLKPRRVPTINPVVLFAPRWCFRGVSSIEGPVINEVEGVDCVLVCPAAMNTTLRGRRMQRAQCHMSCCPFCIILLSPFKSFCEHKKHKYHNWENVTWTYRFCLFQVAACSRGKSSIPSYLHSVFNSMKCRVDVGNVSICITEIRICDACLCLFMNLRRSNRPLARVYLLICTQMTSPAHRPLIQLCVASMQIHGKTERNINLHQIPTCLIRATKSQTCFNLESRYTLFFFYPAEICVSSWW